MVKLSIPAFQLNFDFPGGHTAEATPVPIPNTEVKLRRADDTARVTVWERRSLPGLKLLRKERTIQRPVTSNRDGPFLFSSVLYLLPQGRDDEIQTEVYGRNRTR